jgi:hypothetical protein
MVSGELDHRTDSHLAFVTRRIGFFVEDEDVHWLWISGDCLNLSQLQGNLY